MNARHDGVQQRQCSDEQRPAPSPIAGVRNDEIADAGGDDPADCPEGFQQHRHTAALFGRREFRDQCGGDRQLGARPRPMTSRAISRAASDHDNAIPPLARPKITSVAEKTVLRPTRSATKPPSAAPIAIPTKPMDSTQLFLGRRQIEMRVGPRWQATTERHQTNVHRVERPSNTRSHQQLPVRLVERQSVKTLVASQRDLSPNSLLRCGHQHPFIIVFLLCRELVQARRWQAITPSSMRITRRHPGKQFECRPIRMPFRLRSTNPFPASGCTGRPPPACYGRSAVSHRCLPTVRKQAFYGGNSPNRYAVRQSPRTRHAVGST